MLRAFLRSRRSAATILLSERANGKVVEAAFWRLRLSPRVMAIVRLARGQDPFATLKEDALSNSGSGRFDLCDMFNAYDWAAKRA